MDARCKVLFLLVLLPSVLSEVRRKRWGGCNQCGGGGGGNYNSGGNFGGGGGGYSNGGNNGGREYPHMFSDHVACSKVLFS